MIFSKANSLNNGQLPLIPLHFQRFEFKYYLPETKADKIIPALLNYMDWDPHTLGYGQDYYQVNSLYYDSPDYGCFWDKESGISDRKKLRFRYYSNDLAPDSPVFLEIKRKNDALVIKDRLQLKFADCLNSRLDNYLTALNSSVETAGLASEISWFKKRNCLKPKLFVSYQRKALISKRDKKFRVTFDYNITTGLLENFNQVPRQLKKVFPRTVVLELKFNNIMPGWFHKIIQKYQLQRLAYSKYCNCLRIAKPEFDDNNYNLN
ncbi:MAG: polyphosphate polymerase domain-containing protein [Candidatus Komeilibacteria bacterium]|nr:polyphosphate polymerase domain-containing protein [Candidatus Komeilibacteria bacterium]